MRETGRYGVEAYLKRKVKAAGGQTRKFTSPGRPHSPDQLVIWPITVTYPCSPGSTLRADIHMIETKAPGKKPRPGQLREHKRLRALGVTVLVLDTKEKVDEYVEDNRCA